MKSVSWSEIKHLKNWYQPRYQSSWAQHGGPPVGPRWAPWTLLSGKIFIHVCVCDKKVSISGWYVPLCDCCGAIWITPKQNKIVRRIIWMVCIYVPAISQTPQTLRFLPGLWFWRCSFQASSRAVVSFCMTFRAADNVGFGKYWKKHDGT